MEAASVFGAERVMVLGIEHRVCVFETSAQPQIASYVLHLF